MIREILTQLGLKKNKYFRTNDKFRNMSLTKELFQRDKGQECVDDTTWRDLDMDNLFKKVDFTSTTPGEQVLYKILREPKCDWGALKKDEKVYEYLDSHPSLRAFLTQVLGKINANKHSVFDIIDQPQENFKRLKLIYKGAGWLIILAICLYAMIPTTLTMVFLIPSLLINIFLHFSADRYFLGRIDSVFYLGKMINAVKSIQDQIKDTPLDQSSALDHIHETIGHLGRKVTMIIYVKSIPFIGENLALLFLIRERFFIKIVDEVIKYEEEVMALYEIVGHLDASLSIADYRDSLVHYAKPTFASDEISLSVKSVCHPLLDQAVGNDFAMTTRGIVITGSNMSGKSTFLRTLGVNAIMAQTIHTVIAEAYHASFFKVISSIDLNDSLNEGKSFYKSEADAIHRIIEASQGHIPILSLIDEIFKGTNPVERLSASAEILRYIAERNVLSIVTTHDIDLLPFIEAYDTYYFSEQVEGNRLVFDYKIKKGISPSGNAIKILELIGYPEEIINKTYRRISELTNNRAESTNIS